MTDVQFYHLTTSSLEQALPRLLEKAYGAGMRTVVLTGSEARTEQLNQWLWTYAPEAFLPHGSAKDGHAGEQPIYLTAHAENPNSASVLVVTDGSSVELSSECAKLLDLFDGRDEDVVAAARGRWKSYQAAGHRLTYFRQNDMGGWEKQAA